MNCHAIVAHLKRHMNAFGEIVSHLVLQHCLVMYAPFCYVKRDDFITPSSGIGFQNVYSVRNDAYVKKLEQKDKCIPS